MTTAAAATHWGPFNDSPMTIQPMATAVTGTRLINADACDAESRLMPQLYKPKAPRVTSAPRNTIESINAAVLEQTWGFRGLYTFSLKVFFIINTYSLKGIDGILPLSGTGIADINPFTGQVLNVFDVACRCGYKGY